MANGKPTLLGRVFSVAGEVVVAVYVVLDAIVSPLFGPLMRFLSSFRLIRRIEDFIGRLPPYLILVLLVVPFGLAELAKVYAVLLMAEDHLRTGMTIFVGAYIVSILICERIFQAGKGQLMTIGWFKLAFEWIMAAKAHVLAWVRGTRVWRQAGLWQEKAWAAVGRVRTQLQVTAPPPQQTYGARDESLERR